MNRAQMVANPYGSFAIPTPSKTFCEICEQSMATKDWNSHRSGKKHRANQQVEKDAAGLEKATAKLQLNSNNESDNDGWKAVIATGGGGFGGDGGWSAEPTTGGDAKGDVDLFASFDPLAADANNVIQSMGHDDKGKGDGCFRCHQPGHFSRDCPRAPPRPSGCFNCGGNGHRASGCTNPKKVTCRNCNEDGHMSSECTEPRKMTCRNCNVEGHMAKECPEPRNPATVTCRNCNSLGHFSKDCTEPKNPATVTCRNCNEIGHFSRDCPQPRQGGGGGRACHNCECTEHIARECPEPKKPRCFNCKQTGHKSYECENEAVEDNRGSSGGRFGGSFEGFNNDSFGGEDNPVDAVPVEGNWNCAPASSTFGTVESNAQW